jgi:hypothetical protein
MARVSKPKKRNWQVLYQGELEGFDPKQSIRYWQERTPTERFQATYELICDAIRMKGGNPDELRLLRTTAVLRRL